MADSSTLSAVAGAIPVVGGVISSLINNHSVDATNAANRAFQADQQEKQNAYNIKVWQMQNDYNNPKNVMNRYRAAGLNPNLIYGMPSVNVAAGPAPQAVHNSYVAQPHPAVDGSLMAAQSIAAYNNLRLGNAQIDNMSAQTTDSIASAVLKGVEAGKNIAETNTINSLLPFQADAKRAEINKMVADTSATLTEQEQNIARTSVGLKEAYMRISLMQYQQAQSASEQEKIIAERDNLIKSGKLLDMDKTMRDNGIMPHDSLFMRVLAGLLGLGTGGKSPLTGAGKTY